MVRLTACYRCNRATTVVTLNLNPVNITMHLAYGVVCFVDIEIRVSASRVKLKRPGHDVTT